MAQDVSRARPISRIPRDRESEHSAVTGGWRLFAAQSEPAVISGLVALGIACGTSAKIADESQMRWVGDLGTYPAVWVLALALIGWLGPTIGIAAIRATTFFAAACIAYYAWALYVMNFPVDRTFWLWTGLAITAVPVGAAAICWAGHRRGPIPGTIFAGVAALALADGLVWRLWWSWGGIGAPEGYGHRPFQTFANVAIALVIAIILPRDHRTRLWAAALLLPAAIVMSRIVDHLIGFLY